MSSVSFVNTDPDTLLVTVADQLARQKDDIIRLRQLMEERVYNNTVNSQISLASRTTQSSAWPAIQRIFPLVLGSAGTALIFSLNSKFNESNEACGPYLNDPLQKDALQQCQWDYKVSMTMDGMGIITISAIAGAIIWQEVPPINQLSSSFSQKIQAILLFSTKHCPETLSTFFSLYQYPNIDTHFLSSCNTARTYLMAFDQLIYKITLLIAHHNPFIVKTRNASHLHQRNLEICCNEMLSLSLLGFGLSYVGISYYKGFLWYQNLGMLGIGAGLCILVKRQGAAHQNNINPPRYSEHSNDNSSNVYFPLGGLVGRAEFLV